MQLTIQVNTKGWALFKRRRADKAFRRLADSVLRRDNHTCQYCHFRGEHFQQVVNVDHDYKNNKEKNLACACILCAQCLLLGGQNFGKIIYLPEFSQVELNHMVRVLFCAMASEGELSEPAKATYRNFRHRSQVIDTAFGTDASDAATFGQCLSDIHYTEKDTMPEIMNNLRLLPFRTPIEKPIRYWSTVITPQFDLQDVQDNMV